MNLRYYLVEHFWAGDGEWPTAYTVRCAHKPTVDEVVRACRIDYHPESGEYLDIHQLDDLDNAVVIPETP